MSERGEVSRLEGAEDSQKSPARRKKGIRSVRFCYEGREEIVLGLGCVHAGHTPPRFRAYFADNVEGSSAAPEVSRAGAKVSMLF